MEPQPARSFWIVAAGAGGGRGDGRSRGADHRFPAAMAGAGPVADVRQLDLPGPSLPAPADAHPGAVLPLPQPRREHAQGTRAPMGAASAVRRAQGGGAYRAERRARFDRRAAALPQAHGGAGAALSCANAPRIGVGAASAATAVADSMRL